DERERRTRLGLERDVAQRPDLRGRDAPTCDDEILEGALGLRRDAKALRHAVDCDAARLHLFQRDAATGASAPRTIPASTPTTRASPSGTAIPSGPSPASAARSFAPVSMPQRTSR